MSVREFDPFRLDVEVFAREAGRLEGRWQLSSFERIAEPDASPHQPAGSRDVAWSARGERRERRGHPHQTWLHIGAEASIAQVCQRCLEPVMVDVSVARSFLFVAGEAAAAELDASSDDDVLATSRALDVHGLIEDELLLALPLVPRHEVCDAPLPLPQDDPSDDEPSKNPFSALESLRRAGPLN